VSAALKKGEQEHEEDKQKQRIFRDAAALILEGTSIEDDYDLLYLFRQNAKVEFGQVERALFAFIREYCTFHGLINKDAKESKGETANEGRPTVGDRVSSVRPPLRTGVIESDDRSSEPYLVRWDDGSVSGWLQDTAVKKSKVEARCKFLPEPQLLRHFHEILAQGLLELVRPGGDAVVVGGAALCLARVVSPFQPEMLQRTRAALSALLPTVDAPGPAHARTCTHYAQHTHFLSRCAYRLTHVYVSKMSPEIWTKRRLRAASW